MKANEGDLALADCLEEMNIGGKRSPLSEQIHAALRSTLHLPSCGSHKAELLSLFANLMIDTSCSQAFIVSKSIGESIFENRIMF